MAKRVTSALKAIRAMCRECVCEQVSWIADCPATTCPLWEWRFGLRPRTARKRGLWMDPRKPYHPAEGQDEEQEEDEE